MVEPGDPEEFRADAAFADGPALNWDDASWNPPVLTRAWFHTGAFEAANAVSQQYAHEYWVGDGGETLLPDSVLPPGLDPYEVREAYRSLKGRMLRSEAYVEDAS